MLRLTVFLVLFVTVTNVVFHRPLLEFLFALALAVGLTPELLPMVVTVTLAKRGKAPCGAPRHREAPCRDPRSWRAMDVLCTYKTGTLTELTI